MSNSGTNSDFELGVAQESFSELKNFLDGTSRPKDGLVFAGTSKKSDPENGWRLLNARDDLRRTMVQRSIATLRSELQRDVVPLEYDAVTDSTVGVLPVDFPGGPQEFHAACPNEMIDSTITPKADEVSDIKLRATFCPSGENTFYAFTRRGNMSLVKASFLAFIEKDLLVPADRDVFTFSDQVDFIIFKNYFYVFNASAFQAATNFNAAIERKAEEGLKTLRSIESVEIENFEDLADAIRASKIFARKMAALQYGGYLSQCSGRKIKNYIDEHTFEIDHSFDGENIKITPDLSNHTKRSLFLSVLAEDVFKGGITGTTHRAIKKVPHN